MMEGKQVAGIRKRLSGTEMQELKSARSGLSIQGASRTAASFRTSEEETKIFSHNYPTIDGEPKNSHSAPNYSPRRGSGEGAHHTAGLWACGPGQGPAGGKPSCQRHEESKVALLSFHFLKV